MIEYTPGPWELHEAGDYIQVYGPPAEGIIVAWIGDELDDIDRANARLIAAAPELLDALEQAVQLLENIDGRMLANGVLLAYHQDLPGFRATVRKARGE